MRVKVIGEFGFDQAIFGCGLSHGITNFDMWDDFGNGKADDQSPRMCEVALGLAPRNFGHNKFLEHIELWVLVQATRDWWSQADTYRIATKQSESTMHTLGQRFLEYSDFEHDISEDDLAQLNKRVYRYMHKEITIGQLKKHIPEGFLQTREWKFSYKELLNIYIQRKKHKLEGWSEFLDQIMKQIKYPELITAHDHYVEQYKQAIIDGYLKKQEEVTSD